jgi:hypothetical protein
MKRPGGPPRQLRLIVAHRLRASKFGGAAAFFAAKTQAGERRPRRRAIASQATQAIEYLHSAGRFRKRTQGAIASQVTPAIKETSPRLPIRFAYGPFSLLHTHWDGRGAEERGASTAAE